MGKNFFLDGRESESWPKKRILIPEDKRNEIQKYLLEKNVGYLAFLKLIYGALIRPKEILMLKVGDVSMVDKTITVRAEVSKNGKQRIVPMSEEIEQLLLKFNLHRFNANDYVFSVGQKPGKEKVSERAYRKNWDKIRKIFNLPMEMQQYSLRDTGITEMLKNGLDALSVKQLADHHSLEMTTIYSNHADPNLKELVRKKAPGFSSKSEKQK